MDESRFSKTIKDVSTTEGGWRYDRFSHYLPSHTVEEIVSHMAGNNDVGMDRIIWKHSHDRTFSTKTAYESICDFPLESNVVKWRHLWHWDGPQCSKYFLWPVVKEGLKTNCLRWEHGMTVSSACPLCGSHIETDRHILWECEKVAVVWNSIMGNQRYGLESRNEVVFQNVQWDARQILNRILHYAREFTLCSGNSYMQSHRVPRHARVIIHWTPLQEGWLKWNLDGSICGQSGCAASGGALRDLSGKWIFGFARNVGRASVTLLNYGPSRMKSIFLYRWETPMSGWRVIQLHGELYLEWRSKSSSLFWLGFHYSL
ncbi:Reverse transcriptase zinc-binding domain [Sesbania bispinosa]|nr:Reverse transcriptase zinc-binding domain [Sesbania bispinosa]